MHQTVPNAGCSLADGGGDALAPGGWLNSLLDRFVSLSIEGLLFGAKPMSAFPPSRTLCWSAFWKFVHGKRAPSAELPRRGRLQMADSNWIGRCLLPGQWPSVSPCAEGRKTRSLFRDTGSGDPNPRLIGKPGRKPPKSFRRSLTNPSLGGDQEEDGGDRVVTNVAEPEDRQK